MFNYLCLLFLLLWLSYAPVSRAEVLNANTADIPNTKQISGRTLFDTARRRCPLCDSSVFSYCSDKLFHDSCCCNNPHNPYYPLPPQCQFADCSFLHSNTCQEHKLITACCCINHLNMFHKK